jgi:hypothetical protein
MATEGPLSARIRFQSALRQRFVGVTSGRFTPSPKQSCAVRRNAAATARTSVVKAGRDQQTRGRAAIPADLKIRRRQDVWVRTSIEQIRAQRRTIRNLGWALFTSVNSARGRSILRGCGNG